MTNGAHHGTEKLTKSDLFSMFVRSNLQQASFNFERIHGLGFCYDMIPAIKRLYPLKEDQVAALKRHGVLQHHTCGVRPGDWGDCRHGRGARKWGGD